MALSSRTITASINYRCAPFSATLMHRGRRAALKTPSDACAEDCRGKLIWPRCPINACSPWCVPIITLRESVLTTKPRQRFSAVTCCTSNVNPPFGIRYDGEGFANTSGGLRRGGNYLGNLNLQLTVDAQRLMGWPGATVFLYGLGIHGGHPSGDFVGDAQGVSNIEAPAKWKLEEGWIQQNLFGNRFSALFGRYDLNSEFYRLQSAGLFLNSSFGIGPEFSQSGVEGPSIFPNTSVGGRFEIKPLDQIVLRTAVLDGVPVERPDGSRKVFAKGDGVLVVTEAAYLYRPLGSEQPRTRQFRIGRNCCGAYSGKVALGGWYYSAAFDDLTRVRPDGLPARRHGSGGVYALADWTVYQDANDTDRQVSLFGQLGIGDRRVNRFAYYNGGGLTFSGFIRQGQQNES